MCVCSQPRVDFNLSDCVSVILYWRNQTSTGDYRGILFFVCFGECSSLLSIWSMARAMRPTKQREILTKKKKCSLVHVFEDVFLSTPCLYVDIIILNLKYPTFSQIHEIAHRRVFFITCYLKPKGCMCFYASFIHMLPSFMHN